MRALIIVIILAASFSAGAQVHGSTTSNEEQEAAALFEQGQTAHEKGNLNNAVRLYTSAVKIDPSFFQAYYQRSVALIALDRPAEAESDLRKTLELEPRFARAHRGLGRLLLDRGITDEAKQEFERALEIDPKLEGVRIYYGSALIKTGQPARAVEQLKAAIQNEGTPLAYALLGLAEERTGDQDGAFAAYSQAIAMDTAEVIAREGRARIYEARSDLPRAIEDATAAYQQHPSPELAVKLADLHFRSGNPEMALQIYRDQVVQRPNDLSLHADLIHLMADNGQAEAAQREIAGLITIAPQNVRLLLLAGDLFSKDQPDRAIGYYRTALEIEPGNTVALVQLAAALMHAKQYDQAIQTAQKALANEPDNVPAHSTLATSLFELKQYPQAAQQFVWIVQKKPQVAIAYYFLAISADRSGDCYDALKTYQEFIRRADQAINKAEIENAVIRVSLLEKEAKHGRCKPASKGRK
jgi:tetratricopeptide (TPR) repeat protein